MFWCSNMNFPNPYAMLINGGGGGGGWSDLIWSGVRFQTLVASSVITNRVQRK